MLRHGFYFGELVQAATLNDLQDAIEQAFQDHRIDTNLLRIVDGLEVSQQTIANMTVRAGAGVAYDQMGRRIEVPATQIVDLAPAAVVGAGASKIVSIVLVHDRALSSPVTDDNSVTVYTVEAPSYVLELLSGAEVVGTPAPPAKPADGLVLADITLTDGQTQIVTADIDMTTVGRRDWGVEVDTGNLPVVQVGTLHEAIVDARQVLDAHVYDVGHAHPASAVEFDNTSVGLPGAPDNLQDAIDELFQGSGGVQVQNAWTFDVPTTLQFGTTIGTIEILSGSVDPSDGAGVAAPIGSLYVRLFSSTAQLWLKIGSGDDDWIYQTVGSPP